jgi:hypothetical protein
LLQNYAAGIDSPFNDTNSVTTETFSKYQGAPVGAGCGEFPPVMMDFGSTMYMTLIAGLQGVFLFLIFGLKSQNIRLWKGVFANIPFPAMPSFVTQSKSSFERVDGTASSNWIPGVGLFRHCSEQSKNGNQRDFSSTASGNKNPISTNNDTFEGSKSQTKPWIKPNQVVASYMAE